jgi:hypothetical protein
MPEGSVPDSGALPRAVRRADAPRSSAPSFPERLARRYAQAATRRIVS